MYFENALLIKTSEAGSDAEAAFVSLYDANLLDLSIVCEVGHRRDSGDAKPIRDLQGLSDPSAGGVSAL